MSEQPRQHYGITLAVLALAALSYALLQTMVAPALPEIQRELDASTTSVTWVLTVYLLTASVATPILGRFGDMFGKERTLVLVLCLFALGSVISALSHSIGMLVAGPRRPGRRRRRLPARLRDHQGRVPGRAGRHRHRPDLGDLRHRRRRRARAQRPDRRPPLVRVDLLARLRGRRRRRSSPPTCSCPESPIKSPAKIDYVGRRPVLRRTRVPAARRQRGQPLGLGLARDPRAVRGRRRRARLLGALRAARPGAARGHPAAAQATRLDHQPHRLPDRVRHVRVVHPDPAVRADAGRRRATGSRSA